MSPEQLEILFEELIGGQHKKLFKMGRQIVPRLTEEDLLQPNDYPELEHNPLFRYEEGVIEGLKTAQMAILSRLKEKVYSLDSDCDLR